MTGCRLVTFRTRPSRAVGKGAGLRRPIWGARCGSTDGRGGTASGVGGGLKYSGPVNVDSVLSRFSFVSVVSSDSVDLVASVGSSVSIILKRF